MEMSILLLVCIGLLLPGIDGDSGYSGCGGPGQLTRNHGHFSSTKNGSLYENDIQCHWRIHATAGRIIRLRALSFELEDDNECDNDYLVVYDGKTSRSKLIGRFCGNATVELISSHRYLSLFFETNSHRQARGFNFTYDFVQSSTGCGGNFFKCANNQCVPKLGICDGHNQCGDSSDEENCAASGACSGSEYECPDNTCIPKDWVCDGSNDCGDLADEDNCGKQTGLSGCRSSAWQNGTSGSFSSMDYNGPISEYENDTECHWDINVPDGKFIKLTFDADFEIEEGKAVCDTDRLSIYNGKDHSLVDEYCGMIAPDPIIIPSDHALVKFFSDEDESYKGFMIHWEAVDAAGLPTEIKHDAGPSGCDQWINYTGPGVIQTPNYGPGNNYPDNTTCVWRIFGPEGYIIKVHFNDFGVEGAFLCKYDNVRIYDGPSTEDDLLATICGRRLPRDEWSKSNNMMIAFYADGSYNSKGLNATFEAVKVTSNTQTHETACTKKVTLHGDHGTITSDLYDGSTEYPNDLLCRWAISAPPGKVITLTFNTFETEEDEDCQYDFLRITDGHSVRRLCGFVYPEHISSHGRALELRFITDEVIGGFGFNITYDIHDKIPDCPNTDDFRCNDNSCVRASQVCDGQNDCPGGSEELVCGNVPTCGVPAITPATGNTKIVGGKVAIPNSIPWQVSLRFLDSHMCGGTLISPEWIVTASHCFENNRNPKNWKIYAGKQHEKKDDPHQQLRDVVKILMHDQYDQYATDNDITLLKVEPPFTLNDYVSVACLPTEEAPDGMECMSSGWGDTKGTGGEGILKQVTVPIVNLQKCNGTDYLDGDVTANMICAGYDAGGHDTCQGDSGGPFVCKLSGKWQLEGVVSWGYGCADANSPGAYTRVSNYLSWLQQNVGSHTP